MSKHACSQYYHTTILFVCLIWFFTSQSTIFQLCWDRLSWFEPVLSKDKCVLLKDTTQWRLSGSNPQPLSLESSTLPLSYCGPTIILFPVNGINLFTYANLYVVDSICSVTVYSNAREITQRDYCKARNIRSMCFWTSEFREISTLALHAPLKTCWFSNLLRYLVLSKELQNV